MQIETGKYYRTRDGRKVGPMRVWDNFAPHKWEGVKEGVKGEIGIYKNDGTSKYDPDLIAEWQDEPATKIDKLVFNVEHTSDEPDFAALAAQHRIKITVQVGEVLIEYDGRV